MARFDANKDGEMDANVSAEDSWDQRTCILFDDAFTAGNSGGF